METSTGLRNKFSFSIRDGDGIYAKDITLQRGDLVQVALKDVWPGDYPLPGILLGEENDEVGLVLALKMPHLPVTKSANGDYCSYEIKKFLVKNIGYVQFLARGSAADLLWHIIGSQTIGIKRLREKLDKIQYLSSTV